MTVENVLKALDQNPEVAESHVLVRELTLYLEVGHDTFKPRIGVKIWKGSDYHFSVSRLVQTPANPAAPYQTSENSFDSEADAIRGAVSSTTRFLKMAIQSGEQPTDDWLKPNKDY